MKDLTNLTIRSFRAPDERLSTEIYLKKHAEVLRGIGVLKAFQKRYDWTSDYNSIMIVASTLGNPMIGAIRLQVHRDGSPLDILNTMSPLDPKIIPMYDSWSGQGIGELCGLWVSPEFGGNGIARQLLIAAMAMADELTVSTILCFGADVTTRTIMHTGFVRINSLGNQGCFQFPTEERESYALINQSVVACRHADPRFRELMLRLRMNGELDLKGSKLTKVPYVRFRLDRSHNEQRILSFKKVVNGRYLL